MLIVSVLAVSRGLVEAMGGTLTVDSVLGEGATFVVTLPVTSEPSAGSPPAGPSNANDCDPIGSALGGEQAR